MKEEEKIIGEKGRKRKKRKNRKKVGREYKIPKVNVIKYIMTEQQEFFFYHGIIHKISMIS